MLSQTLGVIAFLCCLLSINAMPNQCPRQQCQKRPVPLLYSKLMTSNWLQANAAISGLVEATPDWLHLKPEQKGSILVRVPLLSMDDITNCDDVVVTVKVFLKDPPSDDSDLLVSICDGADRDCNGIYISDKENYPDAACNYVSLKSGETQVDPTFLGSCGNCPIEFDTFPNAVTMRFYPGEQFGSFSIGPDGGYTTTGTFTNTVDAAQGLTLELYGAQTREEFLLQYLHVEVTTN